MNARFRLITGVLLALAGGIAIAIVDSRPTWDDTGVTVVVVFGVAAIAAALARRPPWLIALLAGGFIPLLEVRGPSGFASLIALVFAGAGAIVGWLVARAGSPRPGSVPR